MRFVLDTNQACKAFRQLLPRNHRLTLSPYVLAEMALHGRTRTEFGRLEHFDVLLGLEVQTVMERIAPLDEAGIQGFIPFYAKSEAQRIIRLLEKGDNAWAEQLKQGGLKFCGQMADAAQSLRKDLVANGISKTAKARDIQDAINNLPCFKERLVSCIHNMEARKTAVASADRLYEAVMQNQYLARLFKTTHYFVLSWSQMWQNQTHNFNASQDRDDWPDLTLPLYAANGDIIVTADKKLRNAITMIEPSGAVQANPLSELVPEPPHL